MQHFHRLVVPVHMQWSPVMSLFFPACMCPCGHAHTTVNESVHFSMFHWPQQYCKPLHIHSSRTPNRKTDKDCGAATSYPSHPAPNTITPHPSLDPQNIHRIEVWCESPHVAFAPAAPVRLFWANCCEGFCHHQQNFLGDNLLEFGLGLPLSCFTHSWRALSLILSLSEGWHWRADLSRGVLVRWWQVFW